MHKIKIYFMTKYRMFLHWWFASSVRIVSVAQLITKDELMKMDRDFSKFENDMARDMQRKIMEALSNRGHLDLQRRSRDNGDLEYRMMIRVIL